MKIVWDEKKNTVNQNIHKIDFNDAAEVFSNPFQIDIDDPDHSWDEQRLILLGRTKKDLLLVVVFTYRGNFIRIISARKPTAGEKEQYAERI
jgi:uncharacterized protein